MKEKEARAKFRQVRKVVFTSVLLLFLLVYNGQRHQLDFGECGCFFVFFFNKNKSCFLTLLMNGKLTKKSALPEFEFQRLLIDDRN